MKQIYVVFLLLLGLSPTLKADHISGGEMFYTLIGNSNGEFQYRVTVRLFMNCYSGRQLPNPFIMTVFNRSTNNRIKDISVPLSNTQRLELNDPGECITDPPIVCYDIGYYHFDVSLPGSTDGYLISCQVVYRINGITNLGGNYGNIGATYTTEIPGSSQVVQAPSNNSAEFTGSDMVVVCANNSFSYSFAARDNDRDGLRYSFCNAYQGGSGGFGMNSAPPQPPPYQSVPYSSDFGGTSPLSDRVKIDQNTGLITGVAPASGVYVVTVCVEEIRNGVVIATQRKDLQINITSCSIASASLQPEYMLCRDTKTISLSNMSTSPLIHSYNWQLLNSKNENLYGSSSPTIQYSFADTGIYTVKLVINRNEACSDSSTSMIRVYPGFNPNFEAAGICFNKPTQFRDECTSAYGKVNSWKWDFGESNFNGFSNEQHPGYTYPSMGTKRVRLIAGNSLGCIDTVLKNISILDKPPISLAFKDTLICVNDKVKLEASGKGNFIWSPNMNIIDILSESPTVSPILTTTYFVDLDDNGCLNRDSVKVHVVDKVSLQAMNDTLICRGDKIQMNIISNGLQYNWSPASQLSDPKSARPEAITHLNTRYQITAIIGGCSTTEEIIVNTVPYPIAHAGRDTMICHNTTAQLSGGMEGRVFTWSPVSTLNDFSILNPVASPKTSTAYILSVYDTQGCPKPGRDTVLIEVLPDINAFAGYDTAVVIGQPLQLNASGGIRYVWSPALNLSDPTISNPVAVHTNHVERIRYQVLVFNEAGCVDTAAIMVKIFKTVPEVFVPNAFTPNGDGRNDYFQLYAVGMQRIEYFNVYNRWGQQVYSHDNNSEGGWNGSYGGKTLESGTFVWMVKAIDYTGVPYIKRGTVTLIR